MRAPIDSAGAGERLDMALARLMEITRSRAAVLIKQGHAKVNGNAVSKAGVLLRMGDVIECQLPEVIPDRAMPQPIALEILYQDADLAVVIKPRGMVVHPAAGNHEGTLVNALLYHLDELSGIGGVARPGIVHRLDKDTSGALLVAKNDAAHASLSRQLKAHTMERAYLAIVSGNLKADEGEIAGPIGRHKTKRKQMAVRPDGKEAITRYNVIERLRGACLVEANLVTGRTHQIRVHMAHIGHPVLGDAVYGAGGRVKITGGQLLHACRLGFEHPRTGERISFTAALPEEFSHWLLKLRDR